MLGTPPDSPVLTITSEHAQLFKDVPKVSFIFKRPDKFFIRNASRRLFKAAGLWKNH